MADGVVPKTSHNRKFTYSIKNDIYTVARPKLRVASLLSTRIPPRTPYGRDAVDLLCPVLGVFWRRTDARTDGRRRTRK